MTDGIFSTLEDYTGYRPVSCPWRAFFDPFVQRVVRAYDFFESGQLSWAVSKPSHRLVDGVAFYHRVDNTVWSKQLRQEREEQEQRRSARG